uniref:RNA polymerase II subunit A C-terminal domain phosphatase n=1 Tax=Rhabditophanes sp. KR3021 TaxID=114890 RepID=A0AC35U912_9BILA
MDNCPHDIVVRGMCGFCGVDLQLPTGTRPYNEAALASTASVSMIHHVPDIKVSEELAKKIGQKDIDDLLGARKLILLVDLDQTIVHTTDRDYDHDPHNPANIDVTFYQIKNTTYFTKLRPHTRTFLERMTKLYQLHIITYGQRNYAHKIAQILDPNKVLFDHRIMSRDELSSSYHKTSNMEALFPCGEELVAIIDDRADVWEYSDRLIKVPEYKFFKETGDINAPSSTREAERERKEGRVRGVAHAMDNDNDDYLLILGEVLTEIHEIFYQEYDKAATKKDGEECSAKRPRIAPLDLAQIIAYKKKQVLRNCRIVLSGIIPIGVAMTQHPFFKLCQQFGAEMDEDVSCKTTHVITSRFGTTKANKAEKMNIFVVSPLWVHHSVHKWVQADEKDYVVTKESDINEEVKAQLERDCDVVMGGINPTKLMPLDLKAMEEEVDAAMDDEDEEEEEIKDEEAEEESTEDGTERKQKAEEGPIQIEAIDPDNDTDDSEDYQILFDDDDEIGFENETEPLDEEEPLDAIEQGEPNSDDEDV